MIYDTTKIFDAQRCFERIKFLIEKGRPVEVIDKSIRSLSQNSYLHLIIGALAMETGNTLEYTKQEYFKRACNPDIFVIEKDDPILGHVTFLKSSKTVSREDMSRAIDRFKTWARGFGYTLPEPEDKEILQMIQIEMGRQSHYL